MELSYNFGDFVKKQKEQKEEEKIIQDTPIVAIPQTKVELTISNACSSCMYSWWPKNKKRSGYCRYNFFDYPSLDDYTPHPIWEHNRIHISTTCSYYKVDVKVKQNIEKSYKVK
jgi:hypothetical protein